MLRKTIVAAAMCVGSTLAMAGSTINPNVPAQNSTLSSAVVRGNFAAAYNDVNNILGGFAGATAPGTPVVFQDWLDTTTSPAVWKKRYTSGWGTIGTFNLSTGVFTPAAFVTPQSANTVLAGPTSGAAAAPAFRALVGADLPLPSAVAKGGVFSKTAVTSNWLRSLGTDGVFTASQPACANISDAVAFCSSTDAANLTGTVASARISGAYSGITGVGTLASGAVPTTLLTGTLQAAQFPALTGDVTTVAGALATTLVTAQPGAHTWAGVQTFTLAPVFTDASGTRTALGLGALATVTPGTGVATALGINVGTAGSIVVNGGALGTPSSGTLTSATGLPISTGLVGTGTGVLTALAINVGSAGAFVTFNGAGGTPSSLVGTNITGTASGLTAGNVTTNANLTGPIASSGNATSITSQTGTGTTFVMSAAPTITGHPTIEGVTSTGATGTGNFAFSISPTFTGTLAAATGTFTGALTAGANGGTNGQITLNGSTSGAQSIKVAAAAGALSALQLPTTNGNNGDVLSTNASGVLSWIAVGGTGTVTSVSAGTGMSFTTITGAGSVAVDVATAANFYAATASKMVDAAIPYTAVPTPAFSATPTFDFSTAASFAPGVMTANITSMTCSNLKANQGGFIKLKQDGTGGRTTVYCSQFLFAGGVAPSINTGVNAVNYLIYTCETSTRCPASVSPNTGWLYLPGVFRPRGMPANDNALLRMTG